MNCAFRLSKMSGNKLHNFHNRHNVITLNTKSSRENFLLRELLRGVCRLLCGAAIVLCRSNEHPNGLFLFLQVAADLRDG